MNLEEEIGNLKYKPGWKFALSDYGYGDTLEITGQVYDSQAEDLTPVTFVMSRLIPESVTSSAGSFTAWVKTLLMGAEYHELCEFFRYKGELVDDPHKSTKVVKGT
jgi:hypothetical protein